MNLKNIILSIVSSFFYIFLIGNSEAAIVLNDGVTDPGGASVNNPEYVLMRTLEIAMYGKTSDPEGISVGYTNMGTGDIYHMLSDGLVIHKINLTTKTLLGHWPLTPANFPCDEPLGCNTTWHLVRWNEEEALEPEVIARYHNNSVSIQPYHDSNATTLGCMGNAPLKYGDIEGDGVAELVLYIGDSLMIFSTQLHKVTFMTMIDDDDWMTEADTLKHFAYHRMGVNPSPQAKDPQYQSKVAASVRGGDHANTPAYRGYAKLYVGDFDKDNASDIIVWRKLYQSNLIENSVKGFTKLKDTLVHFTLKDGEYKRQTTAPAQIQSWLTDNNLSWQKGYPGLSECAGQETQLIPEMHDPLLNDADVLK